MFRLLQQSLIHWDYLEMKCILRTTTEENRNHGFSRQEDDPIENTLLKEDLY